MYTFGKAFRMVISAWSDCIYFPAGGYLLNHLWCDITSLWIEMQAVAGCPAPYVGFGILGIYDWQENDEERDWGVTGSDQGVR